MEKTEERCKLTIVTPERNMGLNACQDLNIMNEYKLNREYIERPILSSFKIIVYYRTIMNNNGLDDYNNNNILLITSSFCCVFLV